MGRTKNLAVNYLWHKAVADKKKAQPSLDLLMDSPVGIGDHSTGDFYDNLDEALNLLVDAQDRIDILKEKYHSISCVTE